jgi:integrase
MGAKNRAGVRKETRRGRVILVIDFRYRDKEGRQRRYRRDASVQLRAAAYAEAQRLERLAAERGTLDAEPEPVTFASFVEGDFATLVMVRFKPSTREGYERLLRAREHGLLALLGRKRLDALGAADARAVEADAIRRKASPRYALACLRTVLRSATELEVLRSMPRLPKLPPRGEKLPAAPPLDLVQSALQEAQGWLRLALALSALAGLRSGEVRALEVRDVDLHAGLIRVRRAFSADEVTIPKGRDQRVVPLAPPLAGVLTQAMAGKRPTDRVVLSRHGLTPTEGTVNGAWQRLQRRLGAAERWHFHQLRHFFATTLLGAGANVEVVRRLLGHKDLASTTRYVHATQGDMVTAIAALPGTCGNDPE